LLGVAIASATVFDRWSYSEPEWQHFLEISPDWTPIADFVDYDAGKHLKQHPEILARYGYSQNDIDLVTNWFFVDPQIVDPKSLNAMLAELGQLPMHEGSVQSGFMAIKALSDPMLLPILLSALLLLVLMPRWSVVFAWMLWLAALFVIGVMGRPGVLRVYVPLESLLFVAPLMLGQVRHGARQWMAALTLFAACVGNAYILIHHTLIAKQGMQQIQRDIHGLPAGPIIIWSGDFPFELAFPVLANDFSARDIKLYGLNFYTHAPFSISVAEEKVGHGFIGRLRSATGIPIMASPKKLELLRIYCRERLNGQLRGAITYHTAWLTVQQVRCEAGE
jgi:hypothetical protein